MTKLMVGSCLCALALAARGSDWSYDSEAGTLSGDGWVLEGSFDASSQILEVGKYKSGDGNGSGLLDLSTNSLTVSGSPVVGVRFTERRAFGTDGTDAPIKEFVCNNVLSFDQTFYRNTHIEKLTVVSPVKNTGWSVAFDCKNLKEAHLDYPNLEFIDGYLFCWCRALKTLTISAPNVRKIDVYAFAGCPLTTGIGAIVNPAVTNIGANAFVDCGASGTLVLTNLVTLGESAFAGAKISAIDLRGPINGAGFGKNAFKNCKSLTSATFDLPNLTAFESASGFSSVAFSSLSFPRKPLASAAMKEVLSGLSYDADKDGQQPLRCTNYISRVQWPVAERPSSGIWRVCTGYEKTLPRPPRCVGVCTVPTDDGKTVGKAWFVSCRFPGDPLRGLSIVIR